MIRNTLHYLDCAATTKPSGTAIEAMLHCMRTAYGNPSSLHKVGLTAQQEVDAARKSIADALRVRSEEICFTSGATESNNLAIQGICAAYGRRRTKIITSAVEHASVRNTMRHMEQQGFTVVQIAPREDGTYAAEDFIQAADAQTCLVSVMLVNNETGYQLPVQQIFQGIHRKNPEILTHCDAVQGFLKVPVLPKRLQADLLSLSGHKVHAAKGVGALYIRKGVRVLPILFGGEQESGLRPGTDSVPLIASFGAAVREFAPTIAMRMKAVQQLKNLLLEELSNCSGITIHSDAQASPYIVNFSVEGIRSEIMLHFLEQKGVMVSSGSACSKGAHSGVLEAFGVKREQVDQAIRVSFSYETTSEDILALIDGIRAGQAELMR